MEKNKILFIGRVSPIKDLEVVIRALPLLKTKMTFEIVGPAENDYLAELKKIINKLKLQNQVRFSPPIYDNKDKIKKIDSIELFILPSKSEGMPQSLIEALARERIVIASDNTGSKDLITDGKNGFLFKIGDEKDLAEVINKIIKMPSKDKNRIKKEARKSVQDFSWSKVMKKIEKLISN